MDRRHHPFVPLRIADDLSVLPTEERRVAEQGVDDVGDLPRLREEVALDEQVVLREKRAEAGMAVIPPDHASIGVIAVEHFVDVFPRFVREGQRSRLRDRADRADRAGDHEVAVVVERADEHASLLDGGVLTDVRVDLASNGCEDPNVASLRRGSHLRRLFTGRWCDDPDLGLVAHRHAAGSSGAFDRSQT